MNQARLVYKGKHLHFFVHETGWEFVRRAEASQGVTIMAVTGKQKIVLVEQYRIPVGKAVIELPAGLVGDKDSNRDDLPVAVAKRELEEETGYSCEEIEVIWKGSFLPGLTDEMNSLCWAKKLKSQALADRTGENEVYEHEDRQGLPAEGEDIRVYDVPLDTAEDWLNEQTQQGKAVDLKVYMAIYFLRANRSKSQ